MTDVFIIHGIGGSPSENWFPWLKDELEKLGCRVFAPRFPDSENPKLESWLAAFEKYKPQLENSIVVSHSLGVAFLLSMMEGPNRPVKAAFFVAGFVSPLNNPEFDELTKTFVAKPFDWGKIRRNCRKFYVISSDNDPYVPLEQGRTIAKNLKIELTVLKNAGHMNEKAGYTRFEFLLEKIKEEL
ncbi:serine hydrolase family protein [Candidatus Micrarchaeota archaeon]|nr:serine hydrolase family protein [Candidatus Micrarchaeota archaeon]